MIVLILGRMAGSFGGLSGLIATVSIFTLPLYQGQMVTVTSSGQRVEETFHRTLLEMGPLEPITVAFFSAMLLFSLLALILSFFARREQHRRVGVLVLACGILLLIGSFLSGFSVGGFYLPGAFLVFLSGIMLIAA